MNNDRRLSDETLNAYLDDALDEQTQATVFEILSRDPDAQTRLCELRDVQDLVRQGYRHPPQPRERPQGPRGGGRYRKLWLAAASVALLFTGAGAGWLGHETFQQRVTTTPKPHHTSLGELAQTAPLEAQRIILHVTSADTDRLGRALSNAETLLERYRQHEQRVEIEIVANAEGLRLLRADTSPYAERLGHLTDQFGNLQLLACRKAIQRLQEQGVEVNLLPESGTTSSALERIVKRMREGWVYIKV